jgi:hypothetical protein
MSRLRDSSVWQLSKLIKLNNYELYILLNVNREWKRTLSSPQNVAEREDWEKIKRIPYWHYISKLCCSLTFKILEENGWGMVSHSPLKHTLPLILSSTYRMYAWLCYLNSPEGIPCWLWGNVCTVHKGSPAVINQCASGPRSGQAAGESASFPRKPQFLLLYLEVLHSSWAYRLHPTNAQVEAAIGSNRHGVGWRLPKGLLLDPQVTLTSQQLTSMVLFESIRKFGDGAGDRGEKWPKHCMHIWINEKKKRKKRKKIWSSK